MHCVNHPDVVERLRYCSRCGQAFCADCWVELNGLTLCAACKNEQVLDIRSGAPLSGGAYDLASIGRRWAAMVLDKLIFIVLIVLGILAATLFQTVGASDANDAIMFAGLMAGVVLYIIYETLTTRGRGQTLGKRALKIRVVGRDGSPVSGGQALGRAITRTFAVSVLAWADYLPAFVSKEKTCVHDLITGSRVVNAE